MTNDDEPVLVVLDKEGKCFHAGQPSTFSKKLLGEYAQEGFEIKTVPLSEFKNIEWQKIQN